MLSRVGEDASPPAENDTAVGANSASSDRRSRWRISLADYGDAINAATNGEPAIVVGHSAGGFTAPLIGRSHRTTSIGCAPATT
ncbi:MAG: hypothetical protein ACR2PK_10165 [Acidimicrobiales bacterium]